MAGGVAAYLAGVQERLRAAEVARAAAQAKAKEERKRRQLTVALAAAVLALASVGVGGGLWYKHDQDVKQAAAAEQCATGKGPGRRSDARPGRGGDAPACGGVAASERGDRARSGSAGRRRAGEPSRPTRDRTAGPANGRGAGEDPPGQIALCGAAHRPDAANKDYADVFAKSYDIRVEDRRLKEEARRIIASPIRWQLVAALDEWAFTEPDQSLRRD